MPGSVAALIKHYNVTGPRHSVRYHLDIAKPFVRLTEILACGMMKRQFLSALWSGTDFWESMEGSAESDGDMDLTPSGNARTADNGKYRKNSGNCFVGHGAADSWYHPGGAYAVAHGGGFSDDLCGCDGAAGRAGG